LLIAKSSQVEKKSRVFTVLLVVLLCATTGYSQKTISGVINQYAKVLSVDNTDRITVSDASPFHPGDTTLISVYRGNRLIRLKVTLGKK